MSGSRNCHAAYACPTGTDNPGAIRVRIANSGHDRLERHRALVASHAQHHHVQVTVEFCLFECRQCGQQRAGGNAADVRAVRTVKRVIGCVAALAELNGKYANWSVCRGKRRNARSRPLPIAGENHGAYPYFIHCRFRRCPGCGCIRPRADEHRDLFTRHDPSSPTDPARRQLDLLTGKSS